MFPIVLIVALGGFLMGFDASVISGVVGFIEVEFVLSKLELGWSVASLALAASVAMLAAGPLSDSFGRKPILIVAAVLFAVSAIASAMATSFAALVIARIVGGLGVGAALIVAPMYIAEISPAEKRGRMVSVNQLNIVVGISVAFFTNYLILKLGQSQSDWAQSMRFGEWSWRWMLGLEVVPAIAYFLGLLLVPESPRWLLMNGRPAQAAVVFEKIVGPAQTQREIDSIVASLEKPQDTDKAAGEPYLRRLAVVFSKPMRLVLCIGLTVAVLQQITGINSVFFYAPMIFEQSGIGTDAAFVQAIMVGLINLLFTLIAMALIDRVGRKPLLLFGVTGIAFSLLLLSWGFSAATYTLSADAISSLPAAVDRISLASLRDVSYHSDIDFKAAVLAVVGEDQLRQFETQLIAGAITINPYVILFGILGFVACFAVSLGPVMWVLFAELFPNRVRGIALSIVGLANSAVSFLVQLLFPWELANLGNAATFFVYGVFALIGLVMIARLLPETRGKSLEELEQALVKA